MKIHHFLCVALAASIPSLVCAQSKWSEPDYQKFAVEPGAQLEVWSWVVGLDSVAKDFEKEFPNIKVKVDNIGGGPNEYQKLQTAPIYNLVALGSLISVLPLLVAFIFLGRYWQGGITAGATKG